MKFTHVFFDLDGTLTDPGIGITNSVAYALKKYGIEPPERKELYSYIGPTLIDSFMQNYGMNEDDAKLTLSYYRERYSTEGLYECVLYDGITNLLSELKKSGVIISLATSKPDVFARRVLDYFDITKYFDFISANTIDESRSKKSDIINYGLENLKASASENIVMVGDRKFDIIGGKETGIKTVGTLYGYGSYEELEKAGADYIAKDVNELKEILL